MKIKSLVLLAFLSTSAFAADIAGSKDPEGIKRYEGSEIIRYEQIKFDSYQVPLGKMTKFDFGSKVSEFEKAENLEGEVTRISYRVPDAQRSSLEVLRNYESAFKDAGWQILFTASGKPAYGNAFSHFYESLKDNDQLFTYSDSQGHLLVTRDPSGAQTAVLFITKYEQGLTRGIKVDKGDPLIQLDLIRTKQMEEKMVVVSASEMAKSIDSSGRISLYGILFDFNKADIKPESEPTLAEITALLNENPNLKLLVVGHTDNVGEFEFNKSLSQKRADAVVAWLVTRSKISASRLSSFGASFAAPVATNDAEDGRAKNRRVELVKRAS